VPTREPLFRDPFARQFLPKPLTRALRVARSRRLRPWVERYADYRAPGARTSAIGRTRFIDEIALRAHEQGSRQLVLLGAGFDCRAHRLAELRDSLVFEVDRDEIQRLKQSRLLLATELAPRNDIRYVAVDFLRDNVAERLKAAGWSNEKRSTFVWEGVSNYLSESAVQEVLAMVGGAGAGSVLVFTYLHRGVLDGSVRFAGADKLVQNVQRLGEPWTFGLEPRELASYLSRFGLELEQDLGADEYRARYRAALGKNPPGYAFYRIAACRVRG
jgi:methyltransferase (TIGR00027 family)